MLFGLSQVRGGDNAMAGKNSWIWVSTGLLCGLILVSYFAVYYYGEYTRYETLYRNTLRDLEALTIRVNILIDYGNGTRTWYNNTRVPLGFTLLNATSRIAKVNYSSYTFGGQSYAFVNKINGVGGDTGKFWLWYYWDQSSSKWEYSLVASDSYILQDRSIVSWVYTAF